MATEYIVLGSPYCSFCIKAKELLESKQIKYEYRDFAREIRKEDKEALEKIAGVEFQTVPQIFKYKEGGGVDYVGGYTELNESFQENQE